MPVRLPLFLSGWFLLTSMLTVVAAQSRAHAQGPSMADRIERYAVDRASLRRSYSVPGSREQHQRMVGFYTSWQRDLESLDFEGLSPDEQVDYVLLNNQLRHELRQLEQTARRQAEMEALLPFAPRLVALEESRRRMKPLDARVAATTLSEIAAEIRDARERLRLEDSEAQAVTPPIAYRAAAAVDRLGSVVARWQRFYDGYDPLFTWWTRQPLSEVREQLDAYASAIRRDLVEPAGGPDQLVGDPIGREALLAELEYEIIPYTPQELLAIAEEEFAWCERERLAAAREMGFGDDWRAAMNEVKSRHVEPGRQPQLIHELAVEAIDFLDQRDLVTIPDLCRETWRMEMLSPESQRLSPYFLGGEVIRVAFPTDAMTHEEKLMTMRGNNRHFARATVHHELIPGHHLQGFMADRYQAHRQLFATPFLVEGWALYWEMLLWDLDFQESPEDRMGMLFWRSHRCARIIFSLRYHLEEMTAPEAVDFLVERVGHERKNAAAEVRRSISGGYGPLYQAAYMLGGLQIRALRRELVDSGEMTDRAFHDAILQENSIPVELIRARLTGRPLSPDYASSWRFYDE